ncbi:hypothetical protein [Tsukamurella tyrosinosolvens]|uniref:hypothetical protein n=1 Tax=Tsukamurella tyrosinosolvens TaxID=57704 RepID=UPI002DD41FF6|nr:hypothetical protein [Tsukamurella tyrosinosolvens]MEC4616201.1 hypothetical protein [Tsukamurella tyrosinosolvens]
MNSLDSGYMGSRVVTDLAELARSREFAYREYDFRVPLQPAEREVGLTEADIWRFLDDEQQAS